MGDHPRYCRFEGFHLDTLRRELHDPAGALVPLTSKAFDVLCELIARRHHVAAKDVLLAAVWPGRIVEENNLTQAIAALRRGFGADAHDRRFIVTVPGRGYRFVAALEEGAEATEIMPPPVGAPPAADATGMRLRLPLLLGVLLTVLLAVLLFLPWAGPTRRASNPATPPAAPPTLAVLPFRALGNVAGHDALLELGLADALASRLGRSSALRVRALESVQRLGPLPGDPLAAGRALGASHVLTGTVDETNGIVQVQARLLPVAGGAPVWSGTFDARAAGLAALQDRIGDAVAAALALPPMQARRGPPAPCDGGDVEAYRALLRAHYRLQHRDTSTVQAYQEAIRQDPACARAYAGLATAYLAMAHSDSPPDEVFPLARAAAMQALKIDPDSAEAWTARGRQLQLGEWDWAGSEQALRRAIALNPSLADAHFALAHLLVTTGRFAPGLAAARTARELDPLSPQVNALEAGFLGAAGRTAAARARLERTLALQPGYWVALLIRGGMALDAGDAAAAGRDLEAAAAGARHASQITALLAGVDMAAGRPDRARVRLDALRQEANRGYLPATSLAAAHAALGDRAAALDALERAEREHDVRLVFLGIDARWNSLRDEPRFRALAGRMQLAAVPASGRF